MVPSTTHKFQVRNLGAILGSSLPSTSHITNLYAISLTFILYPLSAFAPISAVPTALNISHLVPARASPLFLLPLGSCHSSPF